MSEDLPFGSRGGIAIPHYFPVDGEYLIKVRLKRSYDGSRILGLADAHQLDVRLDNTRIKLFPVGGISRGGSGYGAARQSADAPQNPEPVPTARQKSPEPEPDAGLEVRLQVKAGTRLVGVTFLRETPPEGGIFQPRLEARVKNPASRALYEESIGVGSVIVGGPYDVKGPGETSSRHKIFICTPTGKADEDSCAEKIISTLARRAYRRPVADGDVPTLLIPYKFARSEGKSFEAGIEMALRRILVSPNFLFRIERDPENVAPETAYRISDLELASRLSFFLWSSIPDDHLLELAEHGKLRDPAVLEEQVRRMLADSRSAVAGEQFRRTVAVPAQRAFGVSGFGRVPRFR